MAECAFDIITTLIKQFDHSNHHQPEDAETNGSSTKSYYCVCGQPFVLIRPYRTREANLSTFRTICDICSHGIGLFVSYWRCPVGNHELHLNGCDICNQCYTKYATEEAHDVADISNKLLSLNKPRKCEQTVSCRALKDFVATMQQYNSFKDDNDLKTAARMDNEQLLKTYNDYLHLIEHHDGDEQFELIVDRLGRCDITKCSKFKRNYRNRMILNEENRVKENGHNFIVSIMDNMHCYFQHCFDIGNRLSLHDKVTVRRIVDENDEMKRVPENTLNDRLVNKERIQIARIIQENVKKYHENYPTFTDKQYNKYNQLYLDSHMTQTDSGNQGMYQFGFFFKYGYEDDTKYSVRYESVRNLVSVSPHFASLKAELVSNPFIPMTIDQYKLEYDKANIYFNSEQCRKNKSFLPQWAGRMYCVFTMEHVLCLMIYCNYTNLQCEFSKTYRECNGSNHKFFYHW
eukprot:39350_1